MYNREEASKLRQAFWTVFGQYLRPHLSAEGTKVNWINYKTGIKDIYFKMHADQKMAFIGIELTHTDLGIQELFFEQFIELKSMLLLSTEEEWTWDLHVLEEGGRIISRIYHQLADVNVYTEEDWPKIISFLKPRIIALDAFWSDAKYSFDALK